MKLVLLLVLSYIVARTAGAATLNCSTTGRAGETPNVQLTGEVSDAFAQGEEAGDLTYIADAVVVVAKSAPKSLGLLTIDKSYKPRMKERVRFNTESLPASEPKGFDGIVHGFIFPQRLSSEKFLAKVISSDDSYHDGIYSYYSMDCSVE